MCTRMYACHHTKPTHRQPANKGWMSMPTYQRKLPKSLCAHNVTFSKSVAFVILLGFIPSCAELDGAARIVHVCPPRRRGRAEHCAEFLLRHIELELSVLHADSDHFTCGVEDLDCCSGRGEHGGSAKCTPGTIGPPRLAAGRLYEALANVAHYSIISVMCFSPQHLVLA